MAKEENMRNILVTQKKFDDVYEEIFEKKVLNNSLCLSEDVDIRNKFEMMFHEYYQMIEANKSEALVAQDSSAVDYYFAKGFLNIEMLFDFWMISREYIKQKGQSFADYANLLTTYSEDLYSIEPEDYIKIRIMNIIYLAAKAGDVYSINYIIYLYKTYHRKEYNQIKKFRKLTLEDVLSIGEDDGENPAPYAVSRILVMCHFLGKELLSDVSFMYFSLNKTRKIEENDFIENMLELPEGLYATCLEQADKWILEDVSQNKDEYEFADFFHEIENFVINVSMREGFSNNYINQCDKIGDKLNELLAYTLAILKYTFPDKEFEYKEVQCFSHIYKLTTMLLDMSKEYGDVVNALFGFERRTLGCCEDKESVHRLEKIAEISRPQKTAAKPINVAPVSVKEAKDTDYLSVISVLRQKLRDSEEKSKYFKLQYDLAQASLCEANELLKKYENDREELIALRNHVYNLSKEDIQDSKVDIQTMKTVISDKKIVIVGGHTNFINKLRTEFPKWKFYDANVNKINETLALDGTEKLYFFTNHMSHCVYGKYVSAVRENKIPLGYLHTVNIEAIIRQLYKELC